MADSLDVLTTPLGRQPLICNLRTVEALSQPFRYELELVSPGATPEAGSEPEIHPGDLLGKTITVSFKGQDEAKTVRHFHGYVVEFKKENNHPTELRRRVLYRVVLRPWLWLLSLRTNCRVFHDTSVVQIVKDVCTEHGFGDLIVDKLTKAPQPREFVVQYNESDLAFVNRLLEREGIYYYFTHSASKHQLVLVDDAASHVLEPQNQDLPVFVAKVLDRRFFRVWHEMNNLRPRDYSLDDYDFRTPKTELKVKLTTDQQHVYEKGTQFEYPGSYTKREVGEEYVKFSLHAQNAPAAYVYGITQAYAVASGSTFTTTASPGREFLVTREEADIHFNDFASLDSILLEQKRQGLDISPDIKSKVTAVDKMVPFRPERLTPRPVITGVQTARVVGIDNDAPEGSIDIDKHGRVRVKFHWLDRAGESTDAAAQRSCRVRVAQAWAGNSWGMQFIPRVGSEVIVSFQDGDPDRPLIVGSVYNGLWHAPFAQSNGEVDATISGLKTDRAVNGGQSKDEPNLLKFDDVEGKITMKSQGIGVKAIKNVDIEGDAVGLAGGLGGQSKVEVGGLMQAISLSCPFTLTLQTPMAQIELGPRGVVILGNLMVNNAVYPLPPTPVQIAAAVTELGVDFAKNTAMDAAMDAGLDGEVPKGGGVPEDEGVPKGGGVPEDEGVADME